MYQALSVAGGCVSVVPSYWGVDVGSSGPHTSGTESKDTGTYYNTGNTSHRASVELGNMRC